MPLRFLTIMLLASTFAVANPGKAVATWMTSSATAEPGRPLRTAIRLTHDEGWHTYWINPGEAGIPTSVEWKLPPGWKHDGLRFPVPSRFTSSGLSSFGYGGTVLLPVTLTPPEDFAGSAKLEAVISWLACGEAGCVPGEAALTLEVRSGKAVTSGDHQAILTAQRQVPAPIEGVRLDGVEMTDHLMLALAHDGKFEADLSSSRVFPATAEVIDPKSELRFRKENGNWVLIAKLGEYARKPVRKLVLVIDGGGFASPLEITWNVP